MFLSTLREKEILKKDIYSARINNIMNSYSNGKLWDFKKVDYFLFKKYFTL